MIEKKTYNIIMTDNQKLTKLQKKLEIAKISQNNIKEIIKETQMEINDLTYTPQQLQEISKVKQRNELQKEKQQYQKEYQDLVKELKTRINFHNSQNGFIVKNEVVIKDLYKKIQEQELEIKKINNEISINDSLTRQENKNIKKLKESNNIFDIINYTLLGFISIILAICIFKRRYG